MKKILLILLGFTLPFTTLAQSNSGYNIAVKIKGLAPTSELLLANHYGDKQYLKDTSELGPDGLFHFIGDDRLESGIYLVVLPKKTYFEFVISVDEDQTQYYLEADTTLTVDKMVFKGSKENELFLEFNSFAAKQGKKASNIEVVLKEAPEGSDTEKFKEQLREIGQEVSDKRQEIAAAHPNLFIGRLYKSMKPIDPPVLAEGLTESEEAQARYLHTRDHFFDNLDMSEDGLVRSPVFHAKLKDYFDNYIPPLVDTAIMLSDRLIGSIDAGGSQEQYKYTVHYLLGYFEKAEFMCFDKGLWHMAKNYYCEGKAFWSDSSFIAKMCTESAKMEPTLCGVTAPDMSMPDSNFNRRIRMSEIPQPVTVLVFWDINCGHCKKEMPIINRFYDSADKKLVSLYAVYTQGDWDGWKKRIREEEYKFINVANAFGEDKFRKKYNIVSTPQVYILDQNKEIVFKKVGAKDIPNLVDYVLEDQGYIKPKVNKKNEIEDVQPDGKVEEIKPKSSPKKQVKERVKG